MDEPKQTYDVKLTDFTPFVGVFFYQHRNWTGTDGRSQKPHPYGNYFTLAIGLSLLDATTGLIIIKGIESLLK